MAPSTQMGPPATDKDGRGLANIQDDATLLEAPTTRPSGSQPGIEEVGFSSGEPGDPDNTDMLQVETIMTPSGGAARRAWRDVADAASGAAHVRFGPEHGDQRTPGLPLDATTDPELSSEHSSPGVEATRPVPVIAPDDRTEQGARPLPASVSAPPRRKLSPHVQPPPPAPRRRPAPQAPSGLPSFPERRAAPAAPASRAPRPAPLSLVDPATPEGPHGTKKLETMRRPDTRTRSLGPLDDDEPPNEPTRLGELAGPDPGHPLLEDPLASVPVRGAPAGVPQSETVAAPGELAGLIADLEVQVSQRPAVGEGPPPPPDHLPPQTLGATESMVRRGLQSSLPPVEPSAPPVEAPSSFEGLAVLEQTDQELDAEEDDGLDFAEPLEETRALIDGYDPGALSMPGDPVDLIRRVPSILPRDVTPAAGELRSATEAEPSDTVRWHVAPRTRRFLSGLLDMLVVAGLLAVPALLEVFGPEVAEASPIEPDDVSRLLVQGHLTLPLIAGAVFVLLYSLLSTALSGKSLGKLAFGLEVVADGTGARPGFGRALSRALAMLLGIALLGVGPLWVLVDSRCRALHDLLTGTTVVRSGTRDAAFDD